MSTTFQLPMTSVGWVVYSGELSQTRLFLALLQNTKSHSAKCVIAYLTIVESSCTANVAPLHIQYTKLVQLYYCAKNKVIETTRKDAQSQYSQVATTKYP